jgi:Ca-activated chloride channel family protein
MPENSIWEWFSLRWFAPGVLRSFYFEKPVYLYLLAAIPLLFFLRWLFYFRFRQKVEVAFFDKNVEKSLSAWLRYIPMILMALFMAMVLVALARPQRTNEKVEQSTEGIDIMLVIDISESMKIEDFPPNRLEAAKDVAQKFIEGRLNDRIGIVIFAGDAYSLAPLTTDYQLLHNYIESISFDMIQKGGTAIGSALAVATNRMIESETQSKVVILLSDGDNTAGNIDPIISAELAKAYNIKLYTIGVGKEGLVPYGKDPFGRTQYIENTLDETTLRKIANIGAGSFFRAADQESLGDIFTTIDQYEKAEIKETRFKDTRDFYHIYLTWGVAFFLLWLLSKNTFMSNALED